jgi:hypothetical protein
MPLALILLQALQLSNRSFPPSHSPSSTHARPMPIGALPLPAQLDESDLMLFRKLDSGVAICSFPFLASARAGCRLTDCRRRFR